jgi:anti-sigma factor ChrR (cupin superfamily)
MKKCLDEGTLQSYFDGELSNAAAEQVAAHLAECRSCAEAAREVQSEMLLLSVALQPEFEVRVPTERLRGRIDDAIAELQLINSGRAHPVAQAPRSWVGWLNDLFGSSQRAFSYAVVAAVVVASVVLGVIYLKRGEVTPRTEVVKNGGPVPTASPKSSPEVSPVPLPVNSSDVAFRPAPRKFQPRRSTPQAESTAKLLPGEQGYIRTIAALDATIKSNTRPMRPGLQVEYQHNLAVVDNAISATRAAAQKHPRDPDAAQFLNSAYQSKVDLMTQVADARLFNTQPR